MAIKFSSKPQAATPSAASPAKASTAEKKPVDSTATDLFNAPAEPAKVKSRKKK